MFIFYIYIISSISISALSICLLFWLYEGYYNRHVGDSIKIVRVIFKPTMVFYRYIKHKTLVLHGKARVIIEAYCKCISKFLCKLL